MTGKMVWISIILCVLHGILLIGTISSNGVELEKTLLPGEDGSTLLNSKDKYRTITLNFIRKSAALNVNKNFTVRAVE